MALLEIDELPSLSASLSGSNILHTKEISSGVDAQTTVQAVIDLVTDPSPDSETMTSSDFAVFADNTDSQKIKRTTLTAFAALLPVANVTAVTGGWNIGTFQIRYGSASSTVDTGESFNFGTAFDTQCDVVIINVAAIDNASALSTTGSHTTTSFTVNRADSINGSIDFEYIAIGS